MLLVFSNAPPGDLASTAGVAFSGTAALTTAIRPVGSGALGITVAGVLSDAGAQPFIATHYIALQGQAVTFTPANSGGNEAWFEGKMRLCVRNASASPVTVTFTAYSKCSFGALHNMAVTVPASSLVVIGPFDSSVFRSQDAYLRWTYSSTASISVAAVV